MKLRHKLLLLAIIPLPLVALLLTFGFAPQWELFQQSRTAIKVQRALDAADALGKALIDERLVLLSTAADDSVSLDSLLMLSGDNLDSLLSADRDLALGAAAKRSDQAIDTLDESLAGLPQLEALGSPLIQLLELSRALQVTRQSGALISNPIAITGNFKPVLDAVSDLFDRASTWLRDADASDIARARAVMFRYHDASSTIRGFMDNANASATVTPTITRFMTTMSFQEQLQARLLDEVTARQGAKRLRQDAIDIANSRGRKRAIDRLLQQTYLQKEVAELESLLGFGGLVHAFNKYLVQGDPTAATRASSKADLAISQIDRIIGSGEYDADVNADLSEIRTQVQAYQALLKSVRDARGRGLSAEAIGELVTIDDTDTEEALSRLRGWRAPISAQAWLDLSQELDTKLLDISKSLRDASGQRLQQAMTQTSRRLLLLIVTTLIVLLVTYIFARNAYQRLAGGISEFMDELQVIVNSGDIGRSITIKERDELGDIQGMVARYNQRLAELASVAEAMAIGDLSKTPIPASEHDRLTIAIRSLCVSARSVVNEAESVAQGNYDANVKPRSDKDTLALALVRMNQSLRDYRSTVEASEWTTQGQLAVLQALRDPDDLPKLAEAALSALAAHLQVDVGLAYVSDEDGIAPVARLGVPADTPIPERLATDDGQVWRAIQTDRTIVLDKLPPDYLRVASGLGSLAVSTVTVTPLHSGARTVGALEFGWTTPPSTEALDLLETVTDSIGIAFDATVARVRTEQLLQETQALAERLEHQQEQLRASNEELEEQSQALRQSEEELKLQREELQTTNEELEEKGESLEQERRKLETAAEELRKATQYKSEFLANMSHELRTPLNSILILSGQLAENTDGNLSADQAESAQVVNESGRDLLELINDILDLSKVEAGQLEVHLEAVPLQGLVETLRQQFQPQAQTRGITLEIELAKDAPAELFTDRKRLQQIIRNLLSNAIKFTSVGSVRMSVETANPDHPQPVGADGEAMPLDQLLEIKISDSGIGIDSGKLDEIFKPFIQADGSTSRRYGGTGLGLSICREFSVLLGGLIHVQSEPGKGSDFSLILPIRHPGTTAEQPATDAKAKAMAKAILPAVEAAPIAKPPQVADDREQATEPGSSILVIEDDPRFAAIVRDQIRERGQLALVALDGHSGLALAEQHVPRGIVLDLKLPDMDGARVLDMLKQSLNTRHIPVHIISGTEPSNELLRQGAIGFLAKPASSQALAEAFSRIDSKVRSRYRVLTVEDDNVSQSAIRSVLENEHTEIVAATDGIAALQRLETERFDCVVLDLSLPDIDGFEFLRRLKAQHGDAHPPIVVYTGKDLSRAEHRELSQLAESVVVKGADSPERLLDEVTLFLHALNANLPEPQRRVLERLHDGQDSFRGRKLLLVDDDLRNSFALSGVMKRQGFEVLIADNGELALTTLDAHPDTDIVLMDIMMPVMDGYEATRAIRKQERFANLPIIALTAKAMPEDRVKCMEAGANDYLGKPVDVDRLLSVIRVWLGRAK